MQNDELTSVNAYPTLKSDISNAKKDISNLNFLVNGSGRRAEIKAGKQGEIPQERRKRAAGWKRGEGRLRAYTPHQAGGAGQGEE